MSVRSVIALVALALARPVDAAADPIDLPTFAALPRPAPHFEIRYGDAPSQAIDVFLPAGSGPHPVAILIHGGCWKNIKGAGREQLRHVGSELSRRGIAVWSIGYRRADEPGGGYPGTFQDVGRAIDRLRWEADEFNLNRERVVLVGHSAGGHLALWASARRHLPVTSPLREPASPFEPSEVVSLAGIGDLESFAPSVPALCGPGIIERLTNPHPGPDGAYADVSPAALPSRETHTLMISGLLDHLVPPYVARDYERAVRDKGGRTEVLYIADAGHFDLVTPGTHAWEEVSAEIETALGIAP
jgi:acetyl esterase/lipase